MQFLLLVTLVVQSYWDLRCKEIPLGVTAVSAGVGFILSVFAQRTCAEMFFALIPGMVCLGIGCITRQAIGYGDGFLLCAMGMYLSCEGVISICMIASTVAGLVALGLLVFEKKRGKDEIPFVPFLLVAAVLRAWSEKGMIG